MNAFRKAHDTRDMAMMRRLVYWKGVDDVTGTGVENGISMDFGLTIKRIYMEKLADDEKPEYVRRGVTYRPNLPPVGKMLVEFEPPVGEQLVIRSAGYLIGVKDNSHFIVTAAPVSN